MTTEVDEKRQPGDPSARADEISAPAGEAPMVARAGAEHPELPLGKSFAPSANSAPPLPVTEPPAPGGDEQELQRATQTELALLKEAARFATPERAFSVVEALFFAAEKPLDLAQLKDTTQFPDALILGAVERLRQTYVGGSGGVTLFDLGGRWQLRTDPGVGAYVRRMLQVKPMRLTRAALETLAIVAYRQPITRPELEELRSVDCGAVTKALMERKLIRILGKKDEPGRPLLYGTTKEFLELFNLRDLTQLPTLREFQELSEESRKIVEEEAPAAPQVAGLTDLAHDPAVAARLASSTAESDAALSQLESAIDSAEVQARQTAAALAPPPASPEPAAPALSAGPPEPGDGQGGHGN